MKANGVLINWHTTGSKGAAKASRNKVEITPYSFSSFNGDTFLHVENKDESGVNAGKLMTLYLRHQGAINLLKILMNNTGATALNMSQKDLQSFLDNLDAAAEQKWPKAIHGNE